jgi:Copper type II ascorbate-dependent monooxygenase, C-terminal domain
VTRMFRLLLILVFLGSAAYAMRNLFVAGETRSFHAHNSSPLLAASNIPPLLDYIPNYYQHVKPILEANCVTCHLENGIAPFKLTDAASAVEFSRSLYIATRDKRMPPWMPGGESPAFHNTRGLLSEEIAILANWSWSGAPLGKLENAKSAPSKDVPVSIRTDLKLEPGYDFAPNAQLSDEYRCFTLDPKFDGDRFVTGYDILPGNRKLVHHVLVYELPASMVAQVTQREREENDARGGYTCFGGPRLSSSLPLLGAWVPGSSATKFPTGTAAKVRGGSRLLMQVHYNLFNGTGTDQTTLKLELGSAGTAFKTLQNFGPTAPVEIPCPSDYPDNLNDPCNRSAAYARVLALNNSGGNQRRRDGRILEQCRKNLQDYLTPRDRSDIKTSCDYPVPPVQLEIRGIAGHMHYLGKNIKVEINPDNPKKRKVLLEIPRWDFHWQGFYWLKTPVIVNPGDTVRISCTFDNSQKNQPYLNGEQQKPRYIVWGESTGEEMCLSFIQATIK